MLTHILFSVSFLLQKLLKLKPSVSQFILILHKKCTIKEIMKNGPVFKGACIYSMREVFCLYHSHHVSQLPVASASSDSSLSSE